tara:strand:+ start:241 stop:483 length:243 start_codon:yes stop_codon:yes gene_type:complete
VDLLDTTSLDPLESTEDPNMYDAWTPDIEWIAMLFNKAFMEDLSDIEIEIATRLIDAGYLIIIETGDGKDMLIYTHHPIK